MTERDHITNFAAQLGAAGFELDATERALSFGDRFSEYSRGSIAVRVGRDRGDWFLVIGSPRDSMTHWYDAAIWAAYLDSTEPEVTPGLEDSVSFFLTRLDDIEAALDDPDLESHLAGIGRRRALQFLGIQREHNRGAEG